MGTLSSAGGGTLSGGLLQDIIHSSHFSLSARTVHGAPILTGQHRAQIIQMWFSLLGIF
jgi:hypothetical protein